MELKCKICHGKANNVFSAKVLQKYDANFCFCNNCKYLFVEDPFWLDEAYSNAINISDTGLLQRNIFFSKLISAIIFFFFNKNGKFLDYAGGYGVFTRLMRDIGFDYFWSDSFCENLLAKGFEYGDAVKNEIELITALEAFEHFVNPLNETEEMHGISKNIIFSTVLLPGSVPQPKEWWYYGLDHGQHVSFYSKETIEYLSKSFNLNYYNFKDIHLLTEKRLNYSLFNIVAKFAQHGLSAYISKRMKSKTSYDFELLKKGNKT